MVRSSLKVEVGKRYLTYGGNVVTIVRDSGEGSNYIYPFVGDNGHTFTHRGEFDIYWGDNDVDSDALFVCLDDVAPSPLTTLAEIDAELVRLQALREIRAREEEEKRTDGRIRQNDGFYLPVRLTGSLAKYGWYVPAYNGEIYSLETDDEGIQVLVARKRGSEA